MAFVSPHHGFSYFLVFFLPRLERRVFPRRSLLPLLPSVFFVVEKSVLLLTPPLLLFQLFVGIVAVLVSTLAYDYTKTLVGRIKARFPISFLPPHPGQGPFVPLFFTHLREHPFSRSFNFLLLFHTRGPLSVKILEIVSFCFHAQLIASPSPWPEVTKPAISPSL